MKSASAGNLKSAGIYWRWPLLMLMAERFLPLLLLLLSSNQAFQACLNKACLPGRGWIPLWPFALWPKVHSICKVRNSSEVQLMGLSFFSSFGLCLCTHPVERGKNKLDVHSPGSCELWLRFVVYWRRLRIDVSHQQIWSFHKTCVIILWDHD